MKNDLEKFKDIFGYGSFRPMKNGYEVRVQDLDKAKLEAVRVIERNNLKLEMSGVDIRLRSINVTNKE